MEQGEASTTAGMGSGDWAAMDTEGASSNQDTGKRAWQLARTERNSSWGEQHSKRGELRRTDAMGGPWARPWNQRSSEERESTAESSRRPWRLGPGRGERDGRWEREAKEMGRLVYAAVRGGRRCALRLK
uniref:Uncharacterized protein n=1 Tax=Zea mays TaxID=4577 RepID=A0A804PJ86_MAIZE